MILHVDIPGKPVPWQRTAIWRGRRITPKAQRQYQRHVAACAYAALARSPKWTVAMLGAPPGRFSVEIDIVYADKRRRDIDNVAKTILDACNRILWDDDSQIDGLKVERALGVVPCALMRVRRLDSSMGVG